jgi:SAM-dependent methyltransferase
MPPGNQSNPAPLGSTPWQLGSFPGFGPFADPAAARADPRPVAVYRPEVFEVSTIEQAKSIIVTPEEGTTTQERWEKETAYLVEDVGRHLEITPDTCVLDYGCGIGRVAKGLIERFGCRVVGVDFSRSMQLMAPGYVLSERFVVWPPQVLERMIEKGWRADVAVCIWVIQHVVEPLAVIGQIARALRDGGRLYGLNQVRRCIPTDRGWVSDRFDIRAGLCEAFVEEDFHTLPESATTRQLAAGSMIQVLRKAGGARS